MHPKRQSVNPAANPQNVSVTPNRYARSEQGQREYEAYVLGMGAPIRTVPAWQAEADAHYRTIYPTAGNPPRTMKPTATAALRDRVQLAEMRARAHALGTSIRSRHHYARRED